MLNFFAFDAKMKTDDIEDLLELIKDTISLKFGTVLLYITLRHFDIIRLKFDDFLKRLVH